MKKHLLTLTLLLQGLTCMAQPKDNYLWLEGVTDEKALKWVKELNEKSVNHFKENALFSSLQKSITDYRNSNERIPYSGVSQNSVYNYWTDSKNPKGIWRRMPLEKYLNKESDWEIVLDVDQLSKDEKKEYVFRGCATYKTSSSRCLMKLSLGGKDATITREFDLVTKTFVKDSSAFFLPEAKSNAIWLNDNQLLVATDFGKGSMNASGYPSIVKKWDRGTDLAKAKQLFKAGKEVFFTQIFSVELDDIKYFFIATYYGDQETDLYFYKNGKFEQLKIPPNMYMLELTKDGFFFAVKKPLKLKTRKLTVPSGSVINVPFDSLFSLTKFNRDLSIVFSPGQDEGSGSISKTKNHLFLEADKNITAKVYELTKNKKGWSRTELLLNGEGSENVGNVSLYNVNNDDDTVFLMTSGYTSPDALYYYNAEKKVKPKKLYELPAAFDGDNYKVDQNFATSKDGTKIPYFVVYNKNIKYDGTNPTIQYGYGGFEISFPPSYLGLIGKAWLDKGGVYVMANIRGGGEFGPNWHRAAILKNRHKAFEDFYVVSLDLIRRKITSSDHLGIWGGSNGGLLVATMMTRYPELYKAVVCQVPITDMMRYHKLLAGRSWMDEYGDPDKKEMRDYLLTYSPYHNLKPKLKYPEIFFLTSTKDDRVHPAHARKMAAKMQEFGYPFYYYENTEGGHAGAADLNQTILKDTLIFTYLNEKLF